MPTSRMRMPFICDLARYYGPADPTDGDKLTWDERIEHSARCAQLLRRTGRDNAFALAEVLDNCRQFRPCGNAACDLCGTALQRATFGELKARWPHTPLMHYTIIPSDFSVPLGHLGRCNLLTTGADLRCLLAKAGYGHLGGLAFEDLCHRLVARTDRNEWSRHWHLATPQRDAVGLTAALSSVMRTPTTVLRPVVGVLITSDKQKRYLYKPRPARSSSFATRSVKAMPRKSALRSTQLIESLIWLGRFNVTDRVVDLNDTSSVSQSM
ncbi:hypothetical protein SAMN05216374_5920 [Tardiphaga sp. OK246]|nr:hypothetical protein SAMN05216374_5920 [Tardiphaga sp. OK246]